MDADYNIKLCDFGFAAYIKGDGSGYLKSNAGTKGYFAPEILNKELYNGISADVFSLSVVLFIMYTGKPPFRDASFEDEWY